MTTLGPMVRSSAHLGAVVLILGVVQFLLAMAFAQYLYPDPPGYSLTRNAISDLGSPAGSSHALIFDLSLRLLGIAGIIGAVLIRSAFPSKSSARIGLGGLALAGLWAALAGSFSEESPYLNNGIHDLFSALAFFFSGLALIFLALGMVRDTRWKGMRAYTLFSGLVTWIAMALFLRGQYLGIGIGGMERLVVAPILLWGLLAGIHLLRIPRYRPTGPTDWGRPGNPG